MIKPLTKAEHIRFCVLGLDVWMDRDVTITEYSE